ACSDQGPQVLATYSRGELRVADLDRFVRALPERERLVPEGADREAWLEELLRRLASQRIVETGDGVGAWLAGPEAEARRRWAIAAALAAAVTRELAPPKAEEEAVEARLTQLAGHRPEGRWNFRHIFFRLDRAQSESDRRAIREHARSVREQARRDDDFSDLVRRNSQSSDAADGGLVENQRPARLEKTARRALEELAEGEVSAVVETRTGLHLFKLERRLELPPPEAAQQRARVRRLVAAEAFATTRENLLTELRQRFEVVTETLPWQVGSFAVTASDLELFEAAAGVDRQQQAIALLLLAQEGKRRGFLTDEIEAGVELQLLREATATALRKRHAELVAGLEAERLRPIYDARPSAFATREEAHLELIFVPRGKQPFATQREMEDHVAALRAGASFADLARRISTGHAAAEGGDLGPLTPSEWARLSPEVYKAVTAMEPDEVSDPIYCSERVLSADSRLLRGGFAIVRLRQKLPPRERSFEEAIDDVRTAYAQRHAQELTAELRAKILAEADFEIIRLPDPGEFVARPEIPPSTG
ncbi:MAG: peptidylprolyl isomerase, partial [Thermoanaerobaculia bacterium]